MKKNLSRALSAFANTGGGTLILGLCDPEAEWEVDEGGIPREIKGGTREWLEDVIPTLTDLPLDDFNVYKILPEGNESQIDEDKAVYVIDIGDSTSAPHQANDNRYYARVGGKSRPIGHRLVLDIANRRQHPTFDVQFEIRWEERENHIVPTREPEIKPFLRVFARNEGRVMAEYLNCFILMPEEISAAPDEHRQLEEVEGVRYVSEYFTNRRSNAAPMKSPSAFWFEPILPGRHTVHSVEVDTSLLNSDKTYAPIRWRIYADNARQQQGQVSFSEVPVVNSKQEPA